ncbi:hypothetical protein LJC71_02495 [Desulfosarcina sp. OttesenSCG-928-A07]|nr:hypothetical protein [Desulfosarcina sp. OttesenSCG-928-G17]MDL2328606.1 hypothetical protein [Desulfosarcina sp. OttesenSCG-928-A07]
MKMHTSSITLRLCLIIVCSVFLLTGCLSATTQIPYATSVPPEELCTIKFAGNLTVKNFDEKEVNWSSDFGDYWFSVQLPAGEHTFMVDYDQTMNRAWIQRRNIPLTYDFTAGRTYQVAMAGFGVHLLVTDITE